VRNLTVEATLLPSPLRSVVHVLVNLFGGLLAYCHQPKTLTLSLTTLPAVSLPEPERML